MTNGTRAAPTAAAPVGARIVGVGGYRPRRIVGNDEVCAAIQSSDEWIQRRSGVVTRRFADDDETVLSMGVEASRQALAYAGLAPGDLDAVLLATMSYLYQSPSAAPQLANLLGSGGVAALDLNAACAGFSYGLALADALVRAGTCRHVLVVGAEKMTDIVDPCDRGTAFLFGDGAGAAIVGPAESRQIGPVVWGSDGSRADLIGHSESWTVTRKPDGEWPTLRMSGREVYRWVLSEMGKVAERAVAAAGITIDEIDAFVPHQANLRIVEALARGLRLPARVVVAREVTTIGNTSAASIPLAMEELLVSGAVAPGGRALLVAFGAGAMFSAQVVTLP